MSWSPPERPAWVRAIEAGEVPPVCAVADRPLTRASLVLEAAARQGRATTREGEAIAALDHPDFPADEALEALDRFLVALDEEASLHRTGRWMTRRFLLRLLEVRMQLLAWLAADPGVQDEEIVAPLFVAGAPRTGTTILYTLLAEDPAHRVPAGWELLRPVPPPDGDPVERDRDPRIALADRELVLPQTVVSGLLNIHAYGGRKPKECLSAMSFTFRSEELTARYRVPSFERWLFAADPAPAYRMHRLVLQFLQRRAPHSAWVLKCPVHLQALPTLFETYPDARVAITHRDPLQLLASLTSLISNLRWAHSDVVDPHEIAEAHVALHARRFERLVEWTEAGQLPAEQIHHSHFADFRKSPIETLRALYDRFGLGWSDDVAKAMQMALDANPADAHGRHDYLRDELLPAPERLRPRFARYQARFGVPTED